MFSGITSYLWGSAEPKAEETQAAVAVGAQAPDEIYGDLKSMEVTSDLEEGLRTPQSPSDGEEDWVVLCDNDQRGANGPKRAARKAAKKARAAAAQGQ